MTTFTQLACFLDEELHQRVIPFWLRHAVDREFGGLLTCLDEDGRVLAGDKYIWSQARALWVYSTLGFRELADSLFGFCERHGRNESGEWVFKVSREGRLVQGAESIYADGFAMLGLAAYFNLTRSEQAAEMLRETCVQVRSRLAAPGSYGIAPYQLPAGTKNHGISMLFSLAFWEAGRTLEIVAFKEEAHAHAREILDHFISEKDQAILEFLDLDNRPLPPGLGSCCLPGHAFESMWSLIRMFRGDSKIVARCGEVVRWHLEKGWDQEYGGIFLAVDLAGHQPYWPYADYKPWWPAVEAMYALLLTYAETRQTWCLDWYERVHNYAFGHYPVRPAGEWRNRLDRQGNPVSHVIALPVKDPFHLPRALIFCADVLDALASSPETLNVLMV